MISKTGFTTEAQHALEDHPNFYGMSYAEFVKTLIDLPRYIQYLKLLIETDGILDYYVPQRLISKGPERLISKGPAVEYALRWIAESEMRPLAILSTYGMGKTSLAKKVAYECALSAASDFTTRIPIYIPLNLLASQTRIDGLLGSLFTSTISLRGYSYPLFQTLNHMGAFTIFFDGLDEMRHAMTWEDFQYNFRQISELMTSKTKVLLFGRPNIFKTKSEYDQIIGGKTILGTVAIRAITKMGFTVMDISPFNKTQTYEYLQKYLQFLLTRGGLTKVPDEIERRVQDIKALKLDRLLSRPVHAQMMAEIASDFDAKLGQFSRYRLYTAFVSFVLRRDYERGGRVGYSPTEKQEILQQLAWELWFELQKDSFKLSEVTFASWRTLSEGNLRALLTSALMESKYGDNFYFSHRSFQEYLMAEHMLNAKIDWEKLGERINLLSDEIVDFVREADDKKRAHALFRDIESCNMYWDKSVAIAVVLYSTLYRDRLRRPKKGCGLIELSKSTVVNFEPKREPFRMYCHGKMLLMSSGDKDMLRAVIRSMQSWVLDEQQYFFYCAQLLVDSLSSREVSAKFVYIEMIRLVLNWWDYKAMFMFHKGKKYFRKANPDVVVVSEKMEWGTHVSWNKAGIKTASINPTKFYRALRNSDEHRVRLSTRKLSNEVHSFEWAELEFVPTLCTRASASDFGGKVFVLGKLSRGWYDLD